MSRAPPFPTSSPRRPRSPQQSQGFTSPPATAPLSINRERNPTSRPVTPSSRQPPPPPITAGPTRPVRSGLRSRVPSTSSVSEFRDAPRTSTEQSFTSSRPRRPSASGRNGSGNANEISPTEISPTQQAAVAAFRQAARRKASRDDVRDDERRREMEEEEVRQRKMRERTAVRRPTNGGRTAGGEIEGERSWSYDGNISNRDQRFSTRLKPNGSPFLIQR